MTTSQLIAKQLRDVYAGNNWTAATFKEKIVDVTWKEATTQIYNLNTIATLVFHINYYAHEIANTLEGQVFASNDKYAFTHPPIRNEEDWQNMLKGVFADGERLAQQIEKLNDDILSQHFQDEKYGSYYRNFSGIIEHFHYHLGQIVMIKKILRIQKKN